MTDDRPKALVPVGGRPLLAWVLDRVAGLVEGVCVVVAGDDRAVPRAFGDAWEGRPLRYVRQPRPVGVGDAVLRSRGAVEGHVLVAMGDVFFGDALDGPVRRWRRSGADGGVLVEPVGGAGGDPVGLVHLEDGRVVGARKARPRGETPHALAGMAVLPPEALEARPHLSRSEVTGELELEAIVSWLLGEGGELAALPYRGWRRNVNSPADVEAVERRLAAGEA